MARGRTEVGMGRTPSVGAGLPASLALAVVLALAGCSIDGGSSPGSPGPAEPAPSAVTTTAPPPSSAPKPRSRTIADPRITESSGLAASRLHEGVLYTVNDSGDGPYVYALGADGQTVARLEIAGAEAWDWEALAPGWDSDGHPTVWIGDIGDNGRQRSIVSLYRMREPSDLTDGAVPADRFDFRYPDGAHDAEALLVDPADQTLYIVTKDQPAGWYRVPSPTAGVVGTLERVADAPLLITDGAWEMVPDGAPRIVLVSYLSAQVMAEPGGDARSIVVPIQGQRESVAWPWAGPDAFVDSVYVGSEGVGSRIVVADVPAL